MTMTSASRPQSDYSDSRNSGSAFRKLTVFGTFLSLLALSSCSSSPITLYTLTETQSGTKPAVSASVADTTPVLEIPRVTIPAYIDSQDIMVRDERIVERSSNGRWAGRLSEMITDAIVEDIQSARPNLFVTTDSVAKTANARLLITITKLSISKSGMAEIEGNWVFVPLRPT